MIEFKIKDRRVEPSMFGYLPAFFSEDDPRPAKEQADNAYQHGGGWDPFQKGNVKDHATGFNFLPNGNMQYPGDPQTRLLGEAKLRDEVIRIYESSLVVIIQPNGDYEMTRMD